MFIFYFSNTAFSSTPASGENDVVINDDNAVTYNVDRTYFASVSKPDDSFIRWIQLEDRLSTNRFMGSVVIKSTGEQGVSSVIVKLRGREDDDRITGRFRTNEIEPEQKLLTHTTREGLEFDVMVNPHSLSGKSFIVRVKGEVVVE